MSESSGVPFFKRRKALVAVGTALVIAIAGAAYILAPKRSVSTDNAYLQADSAAISPKVRGLVAQVLVAHDQRVHRGDVLVTIDPEEFEARVAAATADLEGAHAAVESAKAALISLKAEEQLAASNVRAAQISIRSADAQSDLAEANQKRYDSLVDSGSVARLQADQFRTSAVTAQVNAQNSRVAIRSVAESGRGRRRATSGSAGCTLAVDCRSLAGSGGAGSCGNRTANTP